MQHLQHSKINIYGYLVIFPKTNDEKIDNTEISLPDFSSLVKTTPFKAKYSGLRPVTEFKSCSFDITSPSSCLTSIEDSKIGKVVKTEGNESRGILKLGHKSRFSKHDVDLKSLKICYGNKVTGEDTALNQTDTSQIQLGHHSMISGP